MPTAIRIVCGAETFDAQLNDSETARAIAAALPIESRANRWGREIYFNTGVEAAEAPDARDEMQVGELAYWPPGKAFCIFFGKTPASRGDEPRAASNVNPIGMVNATLPWPRLPPPSSPGRPE